MTCSRTLLLIALVVAAPLVGCIGAGEGLEPASLVETAPRFAGDWTFQPPVVLDGRGGTVATHALASDPALAPAFVERLIPGGGGEPNIGATSSGAVFVTSRDSTWRSRDNGATWEEVHVLESPNTPVTEDQFRSSDPMLWVDTDTDRVYVDHMGPATWCSYLAWSDDDGETWTDRPGACGVPQIDHQKIITAPHGPGAVTALPASAAYPNVLYMCVNKNLLGTWCAVSHDGGLSFSYDRQAHPYDGECANINGHPAAYPDGTVVLPLGGFDSADGCTRPFTVVVTADDGLTWEARQCDPDVHQTEIDPDITVTPDGTAYALVRDKDQRAKLVRSTDKFATCDVFEVVPPDVTMTVFTALTSGDDDRIAMAFLGTRTPQEPGATPSNATAGSVWHLYVSHSIDANAESPTFVTRQVTPEEDPVQIGCVWLRGGGGGADACRNLLDFIDVHHDDEGRVYVAITDGCTPRSGCAGTPERVGFQSRDRQVSVVVQTGGASLFSSVGTLDPVVLDRPEPLET